MPREQIIFPRSLAVPDDDPRAVPDTRPAPPFPIPHITWHGDAAGGGWVQIMFDCDRRFLEDLLQDIPKDSDVVEIHSEVLDRAATNRLIKAGRRARDQAYGRDE
jgi:hypothetical protein